MRSSEGLLLTWYGCLIYALKFCRGISRHLTHVDDTLFSDVTLAQYLIYLEENRLISPPFIIEILDETHLFVRDLKGLSDILQQNIDKWHDENSYQPAAVQ